MFKRAALHVTFLIAFALLMSVFIRVFYMSPSGTSWYSITRARLSIELPTPKPGPSLGSEIQEGLILPSLHLGRVRPFPADIRMPWWYKHGLWGWRRIPRRNGVNHFDLALWPFFLLVAAPIAYVWWRDRPPPPGHCRICRYDLRGVVGPVCPECGAGAPESSPA